MTTEDSYVRFVTECAILPPLTPGETLHWSGLSPASRGRDLMPAAVLEAHLAMPAQGDPMAGPSVTPPLRSCLALPQVSMINWAMVAATMTFYLAPGLLKPTRNLVIPDATGALVWVRQEGTEPPSPLMYIPSCSCRPPPSRCGGGASSWYRIYRPMIRCSTTWG